jgi:hypothetical protein
MWHAPLLVGLVHVDDAEKHPLDDCEREDGEVPTEHVGQRGRPFLGGEPDDLRKLDRDMVWVWGPGRKQFSKKNMD